MTRRLGWLVPVVALAAALTACTSGHRAPAPSGPSGTATHTVVSTVSAGPSTATVSAPSSSGSASSGSGSSGSASSAPVGPAGGPVPGGFRPASATFISASDGWVLGTTNSCAARPCTSVVRTRDGGASWQGIPAPKAELDLVGPEPSSVSSIRFADQSNGWAFGGQLWATHDGGASWHQLSAVPARDRVASLVTSGGSVYFATSDCDVTSGGNDPCTSTTDVFAAANGSDAFTKLATLPDPGDGAAQLTAFGTDWWLSDQNVLYHGAGRSAPARSAAPCTFPNNAGYALAAADRDHLDALCTSVGASGQASSQLRGSIDGGGSWSSSGPSRNIPDGVTAVSDNAHGVLLVATTDAAASSLLRTTDDGVTLPTVLKIFADGVPWSDAGFTTSSQAFAILSGKTMYLSRDAGATWHPESF